MKKYFSIITVLAYIYTEEGEKGEEEGEEGDGEKREEEREP